MEESNSNVAAPALAREPTEPKGTEDWSAGEQFRLALEAAPTGMIMIDPRGRIVLTNAQVERLFGYDRTELVGKSIEVLVPERLHQHHAKYRSNFFNDPQTRLMGVGRDLYGRRKDGTEVAVEIGLNPVETPEGKFVLSSVVDITERKRIEAALRDSEERFRMMVSAVQDYAILMLDPEGYVVNWNSGAERLKGYQASEIIGKHFSCFYTRGQIDRRQPQYELKLATEAGRFEDEGWRVRKDGSAFWASLVITPVRNRRHGLIGFTKVTRDLTERKRAEEQFRRAIEASPTGMVIVDPQGNITLINGQVEKMFGYAREELIGRPVETLVPQRFRDQHLRFRGGFLDSPQARPMGAGRDLYGLRKDGSEVPIEIGLNPLETQLGKFVLSAIVDITERKRAERERALFVEKLQTFNSQLEEQVRNRTAELSRTLREREVLLQEIHHRVKNNLQVISSLINVQARTLEQGPGRDALEECQGRIQVIALIHEKLYQSKDYANIPFSEYARALAENVFHATEAPSQNVRLELAIEDCAIGVDKAIPCGLILNELISNARRHAFCEGCSGKIRVELAKTMDHWLRLVVSDDGKGLPPGIDVAGGGSLGLQLVRMLVRQINGSLKVETADGTCFHLEVPTGSNND